MDDLGLLDGPSGAAGQGGIVQQPPQRRVRAEQQPQAWPSNFRSTDAGRSSKKASVSRPRPRAAPGTRLAAQ
jgi:hypothetical protein